MRTTLAGTIRGGTGCRVLYAPGTVYHGLPADLLPFTEKPKGNYLAFLGRISPEKRPDRAMEIAAKVGMQLKIAAKIDNADRAYWETVVEPMV
ncbi:hypothetical protein EV291_1761, partial [Rhizobium sp. BK068]